jgi:16S rRNA (cytidine1402-2'-O)-methyltransferase
MPRAHATTASVLSFDPAEIPLPDGLVLVATPIGNLGDVSLRALAALARADLILCEDTRLTARLCQKFGIDRPLLSFHEHNEKKRLGEVLARLEAGERVVLVSDAGTPLLSDPGFPLLRAALDRGLPVSAVPGPNAALLALVLSGLPPAPFLFLGFPPPKEGARRRHFAHLAKLEAAGLAATLIWYEAPHRLLSTLEDLLAAFGPRPAAVARELTKRFEEVRRAPLPDLLAHFRTVPPRGEITLLLAPPPSDRREEAETTPLSERLEAALAEGSLKEAAAAMRAASGLSRRLFYQRGLALRQKARKEGEAEPDAEQDEETGGKGEE